MAPPRANVWFPNFFMTLVSVPSRTRPGLAVFRVSPKMTKPEIKALLMSVYKLPVLKVMTQNFLGKRRRILGPRGFRSYKQPDFKKAYVKLDMEKADNW
mmetsp:Transcript_21704/g.31493  ORF Transcript_21704/g.31493 Transcript_21704/m.31493 type:complete len:99 (-) Transcript_21704:170-466(-)